jgi:hypothetical protein
LSTKKNGHHDGVQIYKCNLCGASFRNKRREYFLQEILWNEYVFHKQTTAELSQRYHKDRRTIRRILNSHKPKEKRHKPRPIHLLVDALYFGRRTNFSSWCVILFKDAKTHENVWWGFTSYESTSLYLGGRRELESLGYSILSVTADGLGCIRAGFSGTPYQMCQVHMERLIIRGTTRNPKTEAGEVLLALGKGLHTTTKETFTRRFLLYWKKYYSFLNERTTHPDGSWSYAHENLRRAAFSVRRLLPYLFTFEKDLNIPKNTNSIEGFFSHMRDLMRAHRGLSKKNQQRVLHTIFLASTTAPGRKKNSPK